MELRNNLTLLVCSCDEYSDIWDIFFVLLNKYWNNLDIRVILNTETKSYSNANLGFNVETFSFYHNSNVPYGKRMIDHLKEIKTPYTLILLDDFFIRENVNIDFLAKVLNYFKKDKKAIFFNFEHSFDSNDQNSIYDEFLRRPKYGKYKLSMQAGIWNTKRLLKMWKKHESPWLWEVVGNERTYNNRYNYYVLKKEVKTPIDYGYEILYPSSPIMKGKWVKELVVDFFEKEGISIDFSVRGFFDKNNITKERTTWPKNMVLKSFGPKIIIRKMVFAVYRKIKALFSKDKQSHN